MRGADYYSARTGLKKPTAIDFEVLKEVYLHIYKGFCEKDYFYEYFGYECIDAGFAPGILGDNDAINIKLLLKMGKRRLWPISDVIVGYSEDDLFDVIEFLYDCISKPSDGIFHSYNFCGTHGYQKFDKKAAQKEYRQEVNLLLARYKEGYSLTENGNVSLLVESGFERLYKAEIPSEHNEDIVSRVNRAKEKFLSRNLEERRLAIQEMGSVLEYLRPLAKEHLNKKDESDLFRILNEFGIRHHNTKQQASYDKSIFYSWMFYYYLATIHALLRIINRANPMK